MAKRKTKNLYPVHTLTDANTALAEIGELERRITLIEMRMNEEIDQAKASGDAEATPLNHRIAAIKAGIEAFSEANKRSLFKSKRSHELDYGTIGFRKSSQIKPKPKTTWAMVLGRLKEMKFPKAIRTKEDVNKDELATWPAERLDLVGARRVEKDLFWCVTDQSKIADTSQK